jgi:hypothetical protein
VGDKVWETRFRREAVAASASFTSMREALFNHHQSQIPNLLGVIASWRFKLTAALPKVITGTPATNHKSKI